LCELGDNLHARACRTEDELRKLEEHFARITLFLKTFDERLTSLHDRLTHFDARVKSLDDLFQERILISEPWLPEEHFAHSEPEYYLVAFLYSFLPNRTLLDVGANVGDFTQVVSDSGYQVYCFEPFPVTFERLKARMADRDNVKTFNVALGSTETTLPLHVASESSEARQDDPSLYNTFRPHFVRESLAFAETVDVPVRTIESLVKSGEVPEQIDFLKVDTEGFDLEVVKGLGVIRPAVVQTEFWGDDFVFVRNEVNCDNLVASAELIREMRNRDYFWNIIVFRVEGENYVRFATNLANAPKMAWGNILFFRNHSLFLEALRWCQGMLPRLQTLPQGKSGRS
jgi:FkbM family methyltransferase